MNYCNTWGGDKARKKKFLEGIDIKIQKQGLQDQDRDRNPDLCFDRSVNQLSLCYI